ncbi:UvrD-helicase domain-containing protein [Phormidium sp. CCY1219]|uniref:UvrD-helicase domain-containing protein n=1 Tax=Phormidium sp. CCY1219 TaxID=2886104 RepID=UPI002D1F4CD7|nr:UvrD-helicase domain-containing protein [Phormidium sp. CCY1219]MEB3828897.1 UvrD-helicase domain-containing protein [Phormidium sp. CCY1219]
MTLTEKQQIAAYFPGSVAVTAGAGTGKTYMLTERYLYHLRQQELSPLEVVAVTFTEKAAAELRSRIRTLAAQELSDRFDILAELEAAQIGTLHALCARICREHPEAAAVPADFTILDEIEGILWMEERLELALERLPEWIYQAIPYSKLMRSLQGLLQDPLTAQRALAKGKEDWLPLVEEKRQQAREALLNDETLHDCQAVLNHYVGKPEDKLEKQGRQVALKAIADLEAGQDTSAALEKIAKIKLTVGSKKNWESGALEKVKEAIKQLRSVVNDSLKAGLINLQTGEADEQLLKQLPALREAFTQVKSELDAEKRRARVLDYADLEVHALEALKHAEVREYYHSRWQAFLVDEFQDTNPIQGEVLQALTQKATLTIVGDVKQAIYGFRRADVEVFETWRSRIVDAGGCEVILDTSFRTHAGLISQINTVFAPVLARLHQDLTAARQDVPHCGPHLQVYGVKAEKGILKRDRQRVEARHIARVLKEMLDSKMTVWDKQTRELRAIAPGDIAILSRAWAPLELYGEALSSVGIPVALAGGDNLLDTREAKDALALLRFLADPADDLALVALLRSPFFAVSDRVLFQLAQTLPKDKIWWQHLKTGDNREVRNAVKVLRQLLGARASEPPTRLLQLSDRLTGYSGAIANLPGAERRMADWRGFEALVRQLERGAGDVFGVVRRLKQLTDGDRVKVPRLPLEGTNAVALTTIHGAKGLEWPVVVVPDLTRQQRNTTEAVYFDPGFGVALTGENDAGEVVKPALYVCLEQWQQEREEAEAVRLLYVALTRARDRLLLTAVEEKGSGLDRLCPGLAAAEILTQPIPFDPDAARSPDPPEPAPFPQPPAMLLNAVGSGIFHLPVTALSEYARCPKRFEFRFIHGHPGIGEGLPLAQRVGTLVHIALERGIRDEQALSSFDPELPPEQLAEAIALAQRFDTVEDFAPFHKTMTRRERSISLEFQGLTLNGVVDLWGENWVLDFKTDREMIPTHHRFQLWAYAKATGSDRAYIAYLRHDTLYSFDRSQLAAITPEAETLVQHLLAGNYAAQPSAENCAFCPYADICPDKYPEVSTAQIPRKTV